MQALSLPFLYAHALCLPFCPCHLEERKPGNKRHRNPPEPKGWAHSLRLEPHETAQSDHTNHVSLLVK